MTSNHTNKNSKTILQLVLNLILTGLGIGVISGSTLKVLSLSQQNTSTRDNKISLFPKQIEAQERILEERVSEYNRRNQSLDLNNNLSEEITSLSLKWKQLASQHKDLEASGYLFMIDENKFAALLPSTPLPAASSIKIPILLVLMKMVDEGEILWDEKLELKSNSIGGGAGWMAYQAPGGYYPTHEVATEMIRVSDNTATNILIQRIGGISALNKRFKLLGLKETTINNLLPDLQGTNSSSTKDLALTLALVDEGKILSQRSRDLFREILSTSTTNRLLPGGILKGLGSNKENIDYNLLIKGYRVYNKTGDIGIAYADAGLIQLPNNTRAVAAFIVRGPFNDPRSSKLIRDMASAMVPLIKPKSQGNSL